MVETGGIAPEGLGSIGYQAFEGIFVKDGLWNASLPPLGSSIDSFTKLREEPRRFFDDPWLLDINLLKKCSSTESPFQWTDFIEQYLNITGDYDGVTFQTALYAYVGFCPDDYLWQAPACRVNISNCFPHISLDDFQLQAAMQKAWEAGCGE